MQSKNVIAVLSRALNLLDYRIIDHGQRVSYMVYKMLLTEGKYNKKDIQKLCFLALLHDIGAFKTESIDSLTIPTSAINYEVKNTLNHSVYGYLFLKKFSCLADFSEAILFHHFRYDYLVQNNCKHKDISAKLYLAGRIDTLMNMGHLTIDENLFSEYRDTVFSAKDIDLIISLNSEDSLLEKFQSGKYLSELFDFYDTVVLSEEEIISYLKTLSYFIDFRSEFTVLHNITTVNFSVEIGKLMGLNDDELKKIYFGAMLHDVGKISTSVMILEKSDKLNDFEYNMVKDHVIASESILKGCVDEDILQIAIRHHEKLDGTGYPKGLKEQDLTTSEQIVAVADILSALSGKRSYKEVFSPEKIKSIITDMANNNEISKPIVSITIENYDFLTGQIKIKTQELIENYNDLKLEYDRLCEKYKGL